MIIRLDNLSTQEPVNPAFIVEGDEALHAVRDLGQTIKRLRLQRKMTQQHLADASGLDIRYVGSIERGAAKSYIRSATWYCISVWDENVGVAEEGEALESLALDN